MPKKPPCKYLLAMYISLDKCGYSDGYELSAKVLFINTEERKDDCHLGQVVGASSAYGIPETWRDLENFRFHYWVKDNGEEYGKGPSWECGNYTDTQDVKRMHRTAIRVERALAKITKERGYCADAAEHMGRVACAIGCTLFVKSKGREQQERSGYRYTTYDSVGEAVNNVRHDLRLMKEKHTEATSAN